jgi:hypothetical protein
MKNPQAPAWHPAQLPPGTKVGSWRVVGLHGKGTYGAVYRAVSVGQEEPVPVALKLALNLGDARFTREVTLLSRLDHPSIPRILDRRSWRHPAGAAYPYLVMEWVAKALELAVEHTPPEADQPLFERGPQPLPVPTKIEALAPVKASSERAEPREHTLSWLPWLASAAVGLTLLLWTWQGLHGRAERVFARVPVAPGTNTPDAGTAVGDSSMKDPADSEQPPSGQQAVAGDEPPEPFPRQATPDERGQCPVPGQVAINGGCWVEQKMSAEACEKNGYAFLESKCYAPAFAVKKRRRPTSNPSDSH